MQSPISRGLITISVSVGMMIAWYFTSGALPLSAHQVLQAMLLPLLFLATLLGAVSVIRGIRQRTRDKKKQTLLEQSPMNFEFLSEAEAAELTEVQHGSPFAKGTALPLDSIGHEVDFEAGVWRETAKGALVASVFMFLYGGVALIIFPIGAVLITALGALLGAMALITRRPEVALGLILANLGLLVKALTTVF